MWPEGETDMNMGEDKDVLAARVFAPPLQWMMQCLAGRASHQELQVGSVYIPSRSESVHHKKSTICYFLYDYMPLRELQNR